MYICREKHIHIPEPKMIGKAVIGLFFFIILFLIYSIYIGTVDLKPYFFTPQLTQPNDAVPCRTRSPLRVYMYDLPRRFNVGMLKRRGSDETPVTAATLPPWPNNTGLKRQHSVEYWMMASLLYNGGGGNTREAVRVSDPASADAFFVPFFSSLSFNTHGHHMTDPETEFDRQLQGYNWLLRVFSVFHEELQMEANQLNNVSKQRFFDVDSHVAATIATLGQIGSSGVDVLEILRHSSYWQKSAGRDHVIPMHHPNAFRFLREQVNASVLIVADFGRYTKIMSNLSKDVVAPYVHVVDSFTDDDSPDPYESRTTLLFFRGRTVRKDEGIIRAKLVKILDGYEDVHYEESVATAESMKLSSQGMRSSKFCLHPAGDTPSSCRLFDAIVSHCIPVIVSDEIELPYEDEIDYNQFSVFFSVKEALVPGFMITQLRQISKERWLEMWRRLKAISHHYEFQYPPKKEDAVNMLWRQVRNKLPAAKLAVHRSQRLKVPDWWR